MKRPVWDTSSVRPTRRCERADAPRTSPGLLLAVPSNSAWDGTREQSFNSAGLHLSDFLAKGLDKDSCF